MGAGCIKNKNGKVVIEEEDVKKVWMDYYESLLNEEFPWMKDSLPDTDPVIGPAEKFSFGEIRAGKRKVKNGKAAGPTGVPSDMLQATGESGVQWVTVICNAVVRMV